jgi:peptide chain release factor 3
VYFGSAIKGIGVADLLDGLAEYGPPPRAQPADKRMVEATEPGLTALVFKIQANMDPNHRDRIAFARVCSGRLVRGMRLKQVRTGKQIPLHAPQFFFAREREIADEAFAGDVVGIPNHGTLRIGDTLTEARTSTSRRAVFRAGNPAPGAAGRRDESEEAAPGPGGTGRGGGGAVVPPARRRRAPGRRGGHACSSTCCRRGWRRNTASRSGSSNRRISSRAGFPRTSGRSWTKFIDENRSAMADDVDGDPVFLATSAFMMRRAEELAPA